MSDFARRVSDVGTYYYSCAEDQMTSAYDFLSDQWGFSPLKKQNTKSTIVKTVACGKKEINVSDAECEYISIL